jgi:molybdopterin-guanine dinucleotide biosynthesis protein A
VADRGLTGILLVGGESRRFGSPKALARFGGETLAERAWRVLGEICDQRLAVGKAAQKLDLPFPVLDDGISAQAPISGVVAGLSAAANELAIVLPVDCPLVAPDDLLRLADACADAAVPATGPLPGAYRRTALPALGLALAQGRLSLRGVLTTLEVRTVDLDPARLANVNTPDDLARIGPSPA